MLMQSFTPGQSISIKVPAKLNLFLDLLGKRNDGYHEISTVMCPIDLWDEVEVTLSSDSQIQLSMSLPSQADPLDSAWQIPVDGRNIAVKAAELARDSLTQTAGGLHSPQSNDNPTECWRGTPGFNIVLRKRIPSSAGLGGGSSDAAAVIVACLVLLGAWNRRLAEELCAKLGSDINFFLGGLEGFGLMLATGRGERISAIPSQPKLRFWLTHPPQGCSTGEVYARVTQAGSLSKTEDFLAACQTGQESKIGAAMFNALQLPATQINGWIHKQLVMLSDCGCEYSQMSGSGSSCFGIAPTNGSYEQLLLRANPLGINRVYQVSAWYGQSIERQLASFADSSCT